MKSLALVLVSILFLPQVWFKNFNEAQQKVKITHQLILVNFSGSDWCGPCIRLKEEIFQSSEFEKYAATNLLLVNADFPRQKKINYQKNK